MDKIDRKTITFDEFNLIIDNLGQDNSNLNYSNLDNELLKTYPNTHINDFDQSNENTLLHIIMLNCPNNDIILSIVKYLYENKHLDYLVLQNDREYIPLYNVCFNSNSVIIFNIMDYLISINQFKYMLTETYSGTRVIYYAFRNEHPNILYYFQLFCEMANQNLDFNCDINMNLTQFYCYNNIEIIQTVIEYLLQSNYKKFLFDDSYENMNTIYHIFYLDDESFTNETFIGNELKIFHILSTYDEIFLNIINKQNGEGYTPFHYIYQNDKYRDKYLDLICKFPEKKIILQKFIEVDNLSEENINIIQNILDNTKSAT